MIWLTGLTTVPPPMPNNAPASQHVVLDNRATPCAVGLIKAARRIREIRSGQILEIWTRDRFAPMEIPLWAERDGYEVVGQERAGAWPRKYWIFRVQRP